MPIEEDSGHWFLMVINIEERKIYQLDPFLTDSKIEGRQQQIKKVVCVVVIITNIAFQGEWLYKVFFLFFFVG